MLCITNTIMVFKLTQRVVTLKMKVGVQKKLINDLQNFAPNSTM
jgi:hypothetical protein